MKLDMEDNLEEIKKNHCGLERNKKRFLDISHTCENRTEMAINCLSLNNSIDAVI